MEQENIKLGQMVYWARILPKLHVYDLYELKVRSVYDTYFVAVNERTKQSHLFYFNDINKTIYFDRNEALECVNDAEDKDKEE